MRKSEESDFVEQMDDQIDIAHQDAMTMIRNKEDKAFVLAQREKGRKGSMGTVDMNLRD